MRGVTWAGWFIGTKLNNQIFVPVKISAYLQVFSETSVVKFKPQRPQSPYQAKTLFFHLLDNRLGYAGERETAIVKQVLHGYHFGEI